jgi:hypothetical protein
MRISEFRCSCSCFAHVDTAVAQSVGSVYRTIINEFLKKKNDFIFSLLRDSILKRSFVTDFPTFQHSEMLKFLFLFLLLLSGTDARGTRRRRRSSSPPRQTCVSPPAKCLANQVRDPRGGACTCRPGMIPHPTQNKCVTCPVGTMSKGYGATVCDPCPGSLICIHLTLFVGVALIVYYMICS